MYFFLSWFLFTGIKGILDSGVNTVIKAIWSLWHLTQISVLWWSEVSFMLIFNRLHILLTEILYTRLNLYKTVRTTFEFNFWRKSFSQRHRIAMGDLNNIFRFIFKINKLFVDIIMHSVHYRPKKRVDWSDIIIILIAARLSLSDVHVRLRSSHSQRILDLNRRGGLESWTESGSFWKGFFVFLVDLNVWSASWSS